MTYTSHEGGKAEARPGQSHWDFDFQMSPHIAVDSKEGSLYHLFYSKVCITDDATFSPSLSGYPKLHDLTFGATPFTLVIQLLRVGFYEQGRIRTGSGNC